MGLGRLVMVYNSLFSYGIGMVALCHSGLIWRQIFRGGAVNTSLYATDAIPGVGPPLRSAPSAPRYSLQQSWILFVQRTNSWRGKSARVSQPVSVIRMLSVISRPHSSSHSPGIK